MLSIKLIKNACRRKYSYVTYDSEESLTDGIVIIGGRKHALRAFWHFSAGVVGVARIEGAIVCICCVRDFNFNRGVIVLVSK